MNNALSDTLLRNAGRVASLAAAMFLDGLRFLRQTLLYSALAMVAALAWLGIAQPRWFVDVDGPQNCATFAPDPGRYTADRASGNSALLALDTATTSDQARLYHQCLAHNAALTDPTLLTRAAYERLVARGDATGWKNLRFYMILDLLVGVVATTLESALRHAAQPGFSVRTDRRTSGPRVIDYGYPSVYRSRRP